MGEKIGSKEVRMGITENTQPQKLSYEELNQACAEMSQQLQQQNKLIQQLYGQMQEMRFTIQNKRLDYLFRVVETAGKSSASEYPCFSKGFVEECISEIQKSLAIPAQEKEEDASKED